jgi:drug/metabolite transporter (DMT)-like permease
MAAPSNLTNSFQIARAGPRSLAGVAFVVTATALWAEIGSSVRLVHADMWTVVFWRGTFSALALFGSAALRSGRRLPTDFICLGRSGLCYAIASAGGTILYIVAIDNTSIADVAVIYATMPFLTAAIAWLWLRTQSNCLTLGASALAVLGVSMTAGGASGSGALGGQAVALVMTLMYAAQAVIMRERNALAVAPMVCIASFTAALVAVPLAHPFSVSLMELGVLALSGIIFGAIGDLLFAFGTQRIPSVQAALLTTLDVPLSALFAWLVAGELPARLTVVGGMVILLAVLGHCGLSWCFSVRSADRRIVGAEPRPVALPVEANYIMSGWDEDGDPQQRAVWLATQGTSGSLPPALSFSTL